MPIPLPNLDDRTFADLTAEARALIPTLHPSWTDHNASDPGITLIELLASLTEMLLFQVNEIPDTHTMTFLRLLNGPGWAPPEGVPLEDCIRTTMRGLNERYRAVTPEDYEHLVREAGGARVRRVRCVAQRDLTAADPTAPAPAHVSVVVVPAPAAETGDSATDLGELTGTLAAFLEPRRILTTRHHVVGPSYVRVTVSAGLALHADAPPADALADARARLTTFLDPLRGGPGGDGWPFGRSIHASEIYAVLEQTALVNFVEAVLLDGPDPIRDDRGEVIGVALAAHELVELVRVDLTGYDAYGRPHTESWTA